MLSALLLLQVTIPAPTWSGPVRPLEGSGMSESSALLRGTGPDTFWTLNDGDNRPELFAVDTLGRVVRVVRISGAKNRDWEALASGRLPEGPATASDARPPRGRASFFIGDIGDNQRRRPFVVIYQVPIPTGSQDSLVAVTDSLLVSYPDGGRDAESMAMDARGDLWIVTKELVREPRLYRIPASRWNRRGVVEAEFVASLPIPSPRGVEQWTTDATWGPGGALVIRTYGALWMVPFRGGRPVPTETRPLCSLVGLGPQGEGVAWVSGDLYAVSSEKLFSSPASIALVRCGT